MLRCKGRELRALSGEEDIGSDQDRTSAPERESLESRIDLACGRSAEDFDIEIQCASGLGRFSHRRLRVGRMGGINQHGYARGLWNCLMQ